MVIPEKNRVITNQYVFHKLLLTSDPYINVYRSEPKTKYKIDFHAELKNSANRKLNFFDYFILVSFDSGAQKT